MRSTGSRDDHTLRSLASWAPFMIAFAIVLTAGVVILFAATQLLAKERPPVVAVTPTAVAPGPSVRLTPAEGGPGSIITLAGTGWKPGDALAVYLDVFDGSQVSPALVAQTVAAADGTFATSFTYAPADPLQLPPSRRLLVTVSSSTTGDEAFAVFQAIVPGVSTLDPSATPRPYPTATAEPTTPEPTSVAECTDRATFVQDVTVPDNTQMVPGQSFVKTWRLRNSGTCTWTPHYALVFARGDQMGAPVSIALPATVPPNATVDLSVSLTAPAAPGTYRGDWQLRNADGELFGLAGSAGQTFWVKITVQSGATPGPTATTTPTPTPGITGWRGEYFANMTLSGSPTITRNDPTLDFNWGKGAPVGLPVDGFSARWTRTILLEAGVYRFRAMVDDGMRLYVDDRLVINEWQDGAQREVSGDVQVAVGYHAVRVEYYERAGEAVARVWWEKLAPSYPDWKGEYWSNRDLSGSPALVRNDQRIDFSWGTGSAAPGLPVDNWSARWSRSVTFEPGLYRFSATSDDGIRFYLDGKLIINEWHDSSGTEVYTVNLAVSGSHQLVVEYYEHGGSAAIKFWWQRIGPLPTATATPTQPPTTAPTTAPSVTPTQAPPTATATPSPTPTAIPTMEPSPTAKSPEPTATATLTPSPTPTQMPPSPTPTPTQVPPQPTWTPTPSPLPAPAGVRLNEIFPVPVAVDRADQTEKNGEWIELYNSGRKAVDLSGWWLDDGDDETPPYRIPRRTVIPPRGFLVFYEKVTGLDLDDGGDTVRLLRPNGQVVEEVKFGPLPPNASYSRDEQGFWHSDWPPSPGKPNVPTSLLPGSGMTLRGQTVSGVSLIPQ